MNKDKIGKIAIDLQNKAQEKLNPIELQQEMLKDFENNLLECIDINKSKYDDKFFIVILTKREITLTNLMRNYFFSRATCPTPTFDQSVFRVDPKTYEVEYIWTIPTQDTCEYLINNALHLPETERELLSFVLDFKDGTLDKICAELNNENMPNEAAADVDIKIVS